MAISLVKGQNVNLSQDNPGLNKITCGLGWDVRVTDGSDFDLDAMLFMVDESGKVPSDQHFVFYNNTKSPDGSVLHTGDNRTGEGEGDDESIEVSLSQVNPGIAKIVFCVNIHDGDGRRQNFGQVHNAFIRLVDDAKNEEIVRYDLSEDFSIETALVVAELYKRNGEWKFKAVGDGFREGLGALCRTYGVNVG